MDSSSTDNLTIRTALDATERALAEGPHPEKARRDAEALVLLALKRGLPDATRTWLIAHEDERVAPETAAALRALLERRMTGEPMQYIAGEAEFYGLPFMVTRDVLIPRPETELLVERAVKVAPLFRRPRIADVGTGSGAIAIAIRHEWPDAVVTATEISENALDLAKRNAKRLGFEDRVRFLQGDLLAPVADEQFDIVVSNPPYVPEGDRAALDVEVRDYEPARALFAGEDGLAVYRRLIPAAYGALAPGGFVLLEIGYGQELPVAALLAASRFTEIEFTPDLQGIPRVASARRP
jgi:release factor glutamine methyltransferase